MVIDDENCDWHEKTNLYRLCYLALESSSKTGLSETMFPGRQGRVGGGLFL